MICRLLSLCALALLASTPVRADDVVTTPKHLVILRQGLDAIYGSYVFAVQNPGDAPARFKSVVMLPKEADDFVPQEGVEPNELTLGPEGVVVDKEFDHGVHIVSIGFRVAASYGRGVLTMTPMSDIQSLTVLLPRRTGMAVTSSLLIPGDSASAPDPQYEAFVNRDTLKQGAAFTLEVTGMPEGRTRIWIVGGGVAALLVVLAGFLALRTRPKITQDAGATVLIG